MTRGRLRASRSMVKGEKLSDVLTRALTSAYPGFTLEIAISDLLVLAEDGVSVYNRLTQLAATIRSQSFSIINRDEYTGVQMVMQNRTIRVFDNTTGAAGGIQILPQELIGQPTWIYRSASLSNARYALI